MITLTKDQILLLHRQLIDEYGGLHGIRDEGLLDSAINAPFQSFGGTEFYPGVVEKAVRLGCGLIQNHPFVDGNKRIGTHAMLVFLDVNQISVEYSDEELIALVLAIAAGEATEKDLLSWLRGHIASE